MIYNWLSQRNSIFFSEDLRVRNSCFLLWLVLATAWTRSLASTPPEATGCWCTPQEKCQCSGRRTYAKNGLLTRLPFTGKAPYGLDWQLWSVPLFNSACYDCTVTCVPCSAGRSASSWIPVIICSSCLCQWKVVEKFPSTPESNVNNSATSPSLISRRQPVPGHFNDDGILDLFIKHSANGTMQVKWTQNNTFLFCFLNFDFLCLEGEKWGIHFGGVWSDTVVFPLPLCLPGAGCQRVQRPRSLVGRVCVSSSLFRTFSDLHLNWPISFPLLGQWTNWRTEKCYQDDGGSYLENEIHY